MIYFQRTLFVLSFFLCVSVYGFETEDYENYGFDTEYYENDYLLEEFLVKPGAGSKKKDPGMKDFFLMSIPKSGTHLAVKLLTMMTGREPDYLGALFDNKSLVTIDRLQVAMAKTKQRNQYALHHTGTFFGRRYDGKIFMHFSRIYPNYVKILQIRDLRDVFVSLVNYVDRERGTFSGVWEGYGLTTNSSFEDKLSVCIANFLQTDIPESLAWYQDPDVFVMRFEDFVGPSGGGKAIVQEQAIAKLANALSLELTSDKLQRITTNLFGNTAGPHLSGTFHSGKIGGWNKHYTEKHKKLFNQTWGYYQQALGYPLAQ